MKICDIFRLTDIGQALFVKVFKKLKAARLEGFAFEVIVSENILRGLVDKGWKIAEGMVLKTLSFSGETQFFFLPYNDEIYKVMEALRDHGYIVRELSLIDGELHVLHDDQGKKLPASVCLLPKNPQIDADELASEETCQKIYDKFAASRPAFRLKTTREVLIKDCFFGTRSFRYTWDLDRFLINPQGQIIHLEIKYKYPTEYEGKTFGFNKGASRTIGLLKECGISNFHIILATPIWKPFKSITHLFDRPMTQDHALWVMTSLNSKDTFGGSFISPPKTDLGGKKRIPTLRLKLDRFRILGKFNDSVEHLSENFLKCLHAAQKDGLETLMWETLTSHRLEE